MYKIQIYGIHLLNTLMNYEAHQITFEKKLKWNKLILLIFVVIKELV